MARVEFAPGVCLPACLPAPERERGSRSFLGWGLAGDHGPGEQKTTEKREREKSEKQASYTWVMFSESPGIPPPACLCRWSHGCSVPLKVMTQCSVLRQAYSSTFLGVLLWEIISGFSRGGTSCLSSGWKCQRGQRAAGDRAASLSEYTFVPSSAAFHLRGDTNPNPYLALSIQPFLGHSALLPSSRGFLPTWQVCLSYLREGHWAEAATHDTGCILYGGGEGSTLGMVERLSATSHREQLSVPHNRSAMDFSDYPPTE